MKLEPGDVILLASDGLQTLTDPEIGQVIQSDPTKLASQGVHRLLRAVENKQKRNQDNATVQMVRLPSGVERKPSLGKWLIAGFSLITIAALAILFAFLMPTKSSDMSVGLSETPERKIDSGMGGGEEPVLVPPNSTSVGAKPTNVPSDTDQSAVGSVRTNDGSKNIILDETEQASSGTAAKSKTEAKERDEKAAPPNEKAASDELTSKKTSAEERSRDSHGPSKGSKDKK
jgi:hypothetical protein